jgi:hypothetical protein
MQHIKKSIQDLMDKIANLVSHAAFGEVTELTYTDHSRKTLYLSIAPAASRRRDRWRLTACAY